MWCRISLMCTTRFPLCTSDRADAVDGFQSPISTGTKDRSNFEPAAFCWVPDLELRMRIIRFAMGSRRRFWSGGLRALQDSHAKTFCAPVLGIHAKFRYKYNSLYLQESPRWTNDSLPTPSRFQSHRRSKATAQRGVPNHQPLRAKEGVRWKIKVVQETCRNRKATYPDGWITRRSLVTSTHESIRRRCRPRCIKTTRPLSPNLNHPIRSIWERPVSIM